MFIEHKNTSNFIPKFEQKNVTARLTCTAYFKFAEKCFSNLLSTFQINDLPRQLFYCHELKSLHLNDNEIGEIPPAIGSLINLQSINLSRNGK